MNWLSWFCFASCIMMAPAVIYLLITHDSCARRKRPVTFGRYLARIPLALLLLPSFATLELLAGQIKGVVLAILWSWIMASLAFCGNVKVTIIYLALSVCGALVAAFAQEITDSALWSYQAARYYLICCIEVAHAIGLWLLFRTLEIAGALLWLLILPKTLYERIKEGMDKSTVPEKIALGVLILANIAIIRFCDFRLLLIVVVWELAWFTINALLCLLDSIGKVMGGADVSSIEM